MRGTCIYEFFRFSAFVDTVSSDLILVHCGPNDAERMSGRIQMGCIGAVKNVDGALNHDLHALAEGLLQPPYARAPVCFSSTVVPVQEMQLLYDSYTMDGYQSQEACRRYWATLEYKCVYETQSLYTHFSIGGSRARHHVHIEVAVYTAETIQPTIAFGYSFTRTRDGLNEVVKPELIMPVSNFVNLLAHIDRTTHRLIREPHPSLNSYYWSMFVRGHRELMRVSGSRRAWAHMIMLPDDRLSAFVDGDYFYFVHDALADESAVVVR